MELIHSAQIESDTTQEALIKPFENNNKIFSRLKKLSVMDPFLSENEAKIEFMEALTKAELQQRKRSREADIILARTHADQKKLMDDISRVKISSANNKKS